MTTQAVHQALVGVAPGSSTWNEARAVRSALRQWGYRSDIFADETHAGLRGEVIDFDRYRPRPDDVLIYHFTTGSPFTRRVLATARPLIVLYHNVTPARYFANTNPFLAARLEGAAAELRELGTCARLAIAHSEFSRRDLIDAGFQRTATIPAIVLDALFSLSPDSRVLKQFDDERVNVLTVGRLAPNKRHEDTIKAFYYYRQIEPKARLFFVGAPDNADRYAAWLHGFVGALGLTNCVHFCGHVTDAQLAAYYRLADVLICMSEHEGFCIPLVEAMRFGVPIVTYASSAIPETLGGAGVLIRAKHFPIVAEAIHLLVSDSALRAQIVAQQKARAAALDASIVLPRLQALIREVVEDTP